MTIRSLRNYFVLFIVLAGCLALVPLAWAQTPPGASDVTIPSAGTPVASSVLPQFIFGGGWYTALYFTNVTAAAVSFPVSFIGDDGTPLSVPALGGSTTQVSLPAYGTAMVLAPNSGSPVEGYAAFSLPAGVFGYAVIGQDVTGQIEQEAVVPLSDAAATSTTLTWDETSRVTGIAIVNPSSVPTTVTVTLWDETGNTVGTSTVALPPYQKATNALRALSGLSGMAGKRGSAQFTVSTGSVAVLGLRFDGLALTSIPTATGAASSTSRPRVLPQFIFGGGWYTALYFSNFTASPVSFPLNFIGDAGAPLLVPALGGSTTQVNIPAHGTAMVLAPNAGSPVEGSATFTLPAGVSGYGVIGQDVAGQIEQEAVVPLSDAAAASNTLTWDETNRVTGIAIDNPSSVATTVAVTVWDQTGTTVGTSSVALQPYQKTTNALKALPGLSGMAGKRGSAQFKVSTGNVAVLGLRFDGLALTSIPTTGLQSASQADLLAERALAQTGLAIGQASSVLQSQFDILFATLQGESYCTPLDGGGSIAATTASAMVYYDSSCTKPYLSTGPINTQTGNGLVISETATYYGLNGAPMGTMALNESAQLTDTTTLVYGLGTFIPATGARTPVHLGVYCSLMEGAGACAGAIAQDFPALGLAIGAVTPLTLAFGQTADSPVTFTGGGSAFTGPIGSLTLSSPSPTSLIITGGTAYTNTTASGGAGAFVLFPPTPTAWTLTDAAHNQQFQISVISNTARNLSFTITQLSSGAVLATGSLDQSGSGAITYSDGTVAAITNWTLAN